MSNACVLVVDDEPKIIRFIKTSLSLSGYDILTASTGRAALTTFDRQRPDLVILDLGLPDLDGLDVLRTIRSYSTRPVLILTARDDEQDKVRGLELGADDYLTKPFGTSELRARIEAVLRRVRWSPQPSDLSEFTFGELHVDFRRRRVAVSGEEVHLTPTEYHLLRVLVQNTGRVLSHSELLGQVWGEQYRNDLAILRVNISRLRQKLEPCPPEPRYVLTIPGIGYTISTG